MNAKELSVSKYPARNQQSYPGSQENKGGSFYFPCMTQLHLPYLSKCGGILAMVSTPPRVSAEGK